ncbi:MAG TPA: aldo/keto reductase [Phycisphaerales bacterium]|nr:aldo/keto reductase [Phycisphaerales bacterium]HMP38615.1 aldo/keto reductase [Phycisphaerales bacterium]
MPTDTPAAAPRPPRVRFGRTGLMVSRIGFGAAPIGLLETERAEATRLLNLLLDRGVNLVDTAAGYRGSEETIGAAISHRRDEFVLVSKCGYAVGDLAGEPWSAQLVAATIDRSLRLLQTDRLDVMLLHSCPLETLREGTALGALVRAREQGKIRFAGYSGDNEAAEWAAAHPEIAVIQTSVNIVDQVNIDRVLPVCRAHDVGVMAKRPIANAAWKDLAEQRGTYATYAKPYTERLALLGLDPSAILRGASGRAAWLELAMRFTLSFPEVATAIVGTTSLANAEANIALAAKGPLAPEQVAAVRDAFAAARRLHPAQDWSGQT